LGARSAYFLGFRSHNGGLHDPDPAGGIPWTRPEALGGPHQEFEKVVSEETDYQVQWRRKKFTWGLPADGQYRMGPGTFSREISRHFNESLPLDTDFFEGAAGFTGDGPAAMGILGARSGVGLFGEYSLLS